ncbi:TPA: hypothetical protein EYO57_16710 [Candidatus Poribacteria bacterium]|nr:hypothetical protein [Candidatus Poribacteria bacterium]
MPRQPSGRAEDLTQGREEDVAIEVQVRLSYAVAAAKHAHAVRCFEQLAWPLHIKSIKLGLRPQ